jgi:hypothetical protein
MSERLGMLALADFVDGMLCMLDTLVLCQFSLALMSP